MMNFGFGNRISARALALAPVFLMATAVFGQQAPAGVENFHVVNENFYRGAQPTDEGFANLAKMGVHTVLDLRETDGRSLAEKKAVEAAGMRYVNVPMQGISTPTPDVIAKALSVINDKDAGKVFVHCRRGADRTGTIVACYRITHDRWESTKALSEAKGFGMAWIARGMQHFIKDYKAPVQNASAAEASGTN